MRLVYPFLFAVIVSSVGCRPEVFHPKPTGYFRIDTPAQHEYERFDAEGFPYTFEYPKGSIISTDTVFSKSQPESKFWINIFIPGLQGTINITYKNINESQPLEKLLDDTWGLSYFHHEKADYISTEGLINDHGVSCLLYTVGGNSASRYQFAATDSSRHFLRGVLYFDVTPNADSLAPVTDFLLQDIQHMLMTTQWK